MQTLKNRILVVDDEPEIVDSLKHLLSAKGYEVDGASSGEEALTILDEKKTDLLLLDIKMPGIQGTEVAKIVKDKYPQTNVIIITGYSQEAETLLNDKLLAGLFTKPVQLQELYNKLAELTRKEDLPDQAKEGVAARVLLIKAKLLFLEPSNEIYGFLRTHFKKLSNRGEDYETEVVGDLGNFKTKISLFNPDILVINAAALKAEDINLNMEILGHKLGIKEILLYNIESLQNLRQPEIERLTKSIQAVCLKNGLIEIKWVQI